MFMNRMIGSMRLVFAGALSLMVVMRDSSMYARAQITSTTVTEVPIGSIMSLESTITTAPTASSTNSYGSMTVQCWQTTEVDGSSARLEISTAAASTVSGAVCWEVFSLNGGIVSIPVTPGPDFEPVSLQSSYVAAATAASDDTNTSSSSSSSGKDNLDVILPAVLVSSIFGIILLIFTTIYLLRWRARRSLQNSRARRWVERNSVALAQTPPSQAAAEAWAMKETTFTTGSKPERV